MNKYVLIKIISTLIAAFSQILLKMSANKEYDSKIKEYLNFYVISAYGLFFLSMLLSTYGFKGTSVAFSMVLESLSYILIPLFGYMFLKEKINIKQFLGIVLILVGIVVYTL